MPTNAFSMNKGTAPIAKRPTTGIGSLPHHNVDAALEFSFRMGIPFLPQIPIRNPWEYMIAQALDDLPGLQASSDGEVTVNLDVWRSRAGELNERLQRAFSASPAEKMAFESFEPAPSVSSGWQPFVWELAERRRSWAKVQIAGPMTAQWALKAAGGAPIDPASENHRELATQIFRLVLARALAMTRRLQSKGVQPILYLDEPGLYGFTAENPRHLLGLQELRLMIQTLRKEGVLVGLHCCSNTDWAAVLSLGTDLLSIDTALSLGNLLEQTGGTAADGAPGPLETFIRNGGRLSLGVIPTGRPSALPSLTAAGLFTQLMDTFARSPWSGKPELVRKVVAEALYTPACGLALHNVADAELVLNLLAEFADYCGGARAGAPATAH